MEDGREVDVERREEDREGPGVGSLSGSLSATKGICSILGYGTRCIRRRSTTMNSVRAPDCKKMELVCRECLKNTKRRQKFTTAARVLPTLQLQKILH